MATRAQVEAQRRDLAALSDRAREDLRRFWSFLDLSQPERVRTAVEAYLPLLTDRYGAAAASVAADYFDDLADAAGVAVRARAAETVAGDAVRYQVRRTAAHLWTPTPEQMLAALGPVVDRYVKAPARQTIVDSSARARARWARVPTGAETCAFCLVMASRGFVYTSEAKAGKGDTFHGDCDCQIVPDWSPHPVLEGYDPEALYAQYAEARDVADSGDLRTILTTLREEQGIR